jgi:glycosyltransferase involved in cell wall biosynthesis
VQTHRISGKRDPITFAFVGSVCVRKGAHLLMDYWVRSGVKGKLLLAGALEPSIERLCKKFLSRDDITVLGFVKDVGAVYRSADVLAFPTLEEGSPLVTYEAAGCGLVIVTTPMGSAGIIQDGINGYVLDPYDGDAWIEAFRTLAASHELREHLGSAARRSAEQATWAHAGQQRGKLLRQLLHND